MDTTFEGLRSTIEANGDVLTITMADLRDIVKAGRLGVHVRGQIASKLKEEGISFYPPALPAFQDQLIRLYLDNTPIAAIVEAVDDISSRGEENLKLIAFAIEKQASAASKPTGRRPGRPKKVKVEAQS